MIKFFKDAISEIYNVTWPTKKHSIHISTVAIVFTLASAVFIWFVDYTFDKWVKSIVPAAQIQAQSKTPIKTESPIKLDTSDIKVKTTDWKDANVEVKTAK